MPVVNVIHSGQGEEDGGQPNAIRSHHYSLTETEDAAGRCWRRRDDRRLRCRPELQANGPGTAPPTIGVFCHEYGHALGLPDLYDTTIASQGVGKWSLMGAGTWNGVKRAGDCPAHLDAWSKIKLLSVGADQLYP